MLFEVGDMIRYKHPNAGTNHYDTVFITEVIEDGVYGECINEPIDIIGYANRFIAFIHLEHWEKL